MRRILYILVVLLSISLGALAQQAQPSAQFTVSATSICLGDSVLVTYTGYSNSATSTFTWNFGGAGKVNGANPTGPYEVHFNSAATYTISLNVDSNGVASNNSAAIIVNDTPTGNIVVTDTLCYGNTASFMYNVIADAPVQYKWSYAPGVYQSGTNAGPIIVSYTAPAAQSNKSYPVHVTVTDQNGCKAHFSNQFFLAPLPSNLAISAKPFQGCLPLTVAFNDSFSKDIKHLKWYFDNISGDTTDVLAPSFTYGTKGIYSIKMVAYGVYNCADSVTYTNLITVFPPPTGQIATIDTGCFKGDISLSFSGSTGGSGTYTWGYAPGAYVSGTSTGPGPILVNYDTSTFYPAINAVPNKTYHITLNVVDQHGCTANFTDSFFLAPLPQDINFDDTPKVGCAPLTVTFSDSTIGAKAYLWSFGDGTTSNQQFNTHIYPYGGTYSVTLTAFGIHNCAQSTVHPNAITVYPPPAVNFYTSPLDNVPIQLSQATLSFFNETNGINKFQWFFGDSVITHGDSSYATDTIHTYTKPGTYIVWLHAVDTAGCVDSAYHLIVIIPNAEVFIPNTFTPNGDGRNDTWLVYGHDIELVQMRIYDRWGEEVYSSEDFFAGWDGTFHGKPANTGVYSYVATVYRTGDRIEHYRGGVTLIR